MKENYNAGIINETILKRMVSANKKMFPQGVPECGADALRMTLCAHNIKSQYKLVFCFFANIQCYS